MAAEQPLALDFFAGGVPAGAIFQLQAREIKRLLAVKPGKAIGLTLEEVCFIGLISFFEAFCRNCFASLINICPELLVRLKSKNYDVTIDSLAALEMESTLPYSIGFLVSERFDFGNSQKINALYSALIGITPFSKDEMKTFDKVLADRNLLVHHGGIYTHSYFHQRIGLPSDEKHPFMGSLVVDTDYVTSRFDFLYGITEKIIKASHGAITKQIASGELSVIKPAQDALEMFNWWDEE